MTINRAEITASLLARASDKTRVPLAMAFIEPLLACIDSGFDLATPPASTDDMVNVIHAVTDEEKTGINPKRISVSKNERGLLFIDDATRGRGFGEELRDNAYSSLRNTPYWAPTPLQHFSSPLPYEIDRVFKNEVSNRMDRHYRQELSRVASAVTAAAATVCVALETFFVLTCAGRGGEKAFIKRIKPVILNLPRFIPLARVKGKPETWTVLTP